MGLEKLPLFDFPDSSLLLAMGRPLQEHLVQEGELLVINLLEKGQLVEGLPHVAGLADDGAPDVLAFAADLLAVVFKFESKPAY